MSGVDKILGITIIKLKIFKITKRVRIFVVDKKDYKYDLLIGLDLIPEFGLCLDQTLNISQINQPSLISVENINNTKINSSNTDSNNNNANINWNESIPIEKFEAKVSHLDKDKRDRIYDFIDRHGSAFAKDALDVGTVRGYEAHINLIEDRYIAKKPYRCSYEDQQEIERQVAELLRHGMIQESCSPFAAPVTMAFKKTGEGSTKEKTRMCIDFRELNKLLVPESQPFPLIDDIITKTRDCRWFTALDINSAFWSIPIRKSDRFKTAFTTSQGHYEWSNMPFGLKNSPAIFQRIFSGIIRRNNLSDFCTNYIDDILIYSKTFEEHMTHLEALVQAIEKEGFKLKFIKCNFASHSVQYLGHILGHNTVQPLHDNLIAIKNFPIPRNRKNIRQFLGKINFYHKFICNAASTLEIFHNLLRKDVPFNWTPECQKSFEEVKEYLTSSPILAIFDRDKPIRIYTDASGVGIGAVLKQKQANGLEKPVAYFLKKLNEAQKKKKSDLHRKSRY